MTVTRRIGSRGADGWQPDYPVGLCVLPLPSRPSSPDRVLLVADYLDHCVHAFALDDGRWLYAFGSRSEVSDDDDDGQLSQPYAVCAVSSNAVLVSDCYNDRISAFFLNPPCPASQRRQLSAVVGRDESSLVMAYLAPDTAQFVYSFGSQGSDPGQFSFPRGLCVSRGELFVCDCNNACIQVFELSDEPIQVFNLTYDTLLGQYHGLAPSLRFLRQWSLASGSERLDRHPDSVAVAELAGEDGRSNDEVFILDSAHHRVQVFSRDGHFLRAIGSPGSGDGQLNQPSAVLVNGDQLLVADSFNHRITVFDRVTGRWLHHIALPNATPYALAMCSIGRSTSSAASNIPTLLISEPSKHCVLLLQPDPPPNDVDRPSSHEH